MKKQKKKNYSVFIRNSQNIYEPVYDLENEIAQFVSLESEIEYRDFVLVREKETYPYPIKSDLIKYKAVLFPSEALDYGDEKQLLQDIRNYIHKYLEVSDFFEKIVPYYVLFSWLFDKFKELPYLRAIGDYGCGKSRFLKVIGSVCYRPMFTAGATTTAPIFRIINQFRGTLILDEADMRWSDTNNEMVKILNNGFQDDIPVLRCSGDDHEVKSFNVFGPKIVATRNKFHDKALESRFLVEYMDGKLTRKDIPYNLDDNFDKEALEIRNKCLMWRLRNYSKDYESDKTYDHSIEPRLNQIISPLLSVIEDEQTRLELREFVKKYNEELKTDRGFSFEAPILETIISLMDDGSDLTTMKTISEAYNNRSQGTEKELSPRKMGGIIKDKFRLKTTKTRNGYVLDEVSYKENIDRLSKKYGIEREHVNIVNVSEGGKDEFTREIEELNRHKLPDFL